MKKNFLFLSILLLFLMVGTACSDNESLDQSLVGAWQLEAITVDGDQQQIGAETAQVINIKSNNVFKRYYTQRNIIKIGGWSYNSDMLNISLDMPTAYYVESVNSTTLTLRCLNFNQEGKVTTTIITYKKVDESLIPEK